MTAKWRKGTGGPAGDEAYNLVAHEVAASLTRGAESAGAGGYAGRRREDDYNLVAHALRDGSLDVSQALAFDLRGRDGGAQFEGPHETASGGSSRSYVATRWAVRRLTPLECERLQGMPDGWTNVPHRGGAAADGPRYQAIGNSMAVNVMRWIGRRIALVDGICEGVAA